MWFRRLLNDLHEEFRNLRHGSLHPNCNPLGDGLDCLRQCRQSRRHRTRTPVTSPEEQERVLTVLDQTAITQITVYAQLYRRLSPATADRVDFLSVHGVALRILNRRGIAVDLDATRVSTVFNLVWSRHRHDFAEGTLTREYFREEIEH